MALHLTTSGTVVLTRTAASGPTRTGSVGKPAPAVLLVVTTVTKPTARKTYRRIVQREECRQIRLAQQSHSRKVYADLRPSPPSSTR